MSRYDHIHHVAVDIDGTLLDTSAAKHLLVGTAEGLHAFHVAVADAPAHSDTVAWVNELKDFDIKITIFTHREQHRETETREWLQRAGVRYDALVMRPDSGLPAYRWKTAWASENSVDLALEDAALTLAALHDSGVRVVACPMLACDADRRVSR